MRDWSSLYGPQLLTCWSFDREVCPSCLHCLHMISRRFEATTGWDIMIILEKISCRFILILCVCVCSIIRPRKLVHWACRLHPMVCSSFHQGCHQPWSSSYPLTRVASPWSRAGRQNPCHEKFCGQALLDPLLILDTLFLRSSKGHKVSRMRDSARVASPWSWKKNLRQLIVRGRGFQVIYFIYIYLLRY